MFWRGLPGLCLVVLSSASLPCLPGWDQNPALDDSSCFLVVNSSSYWPGAHITTPWHICELYGGHMVSVHDAFTNAYLLQIANKRLAYYAKNASADFWLGSEFYNENWVWYDGTPWDYTNWASGQPIDPWTYSHVCMNASNGKWYSTNTPYTCHYPDVSLEQQFLSPFICKTTFKYACDDLTNDACKCAQDWMYFNGTDSCYKAFPYSGQLNFFYDELETLCNVFPGGHALSIHSRAENDFVMFMGSLGYGWTYVWLGLKKLNNQYTWLDGSPYDYNQFTGDQFQNLNESYITMTACTEAFCGNTYKNETWGDWTHNPPSVSLISLNNGFIDGSNAVCKMKARKSVV